MERLWGPVLWVLAGITGAGMVAAEESARVEHARRAAALTPGDAEARVKLGQWCDAKRLPDLADRLYREAIEIAPDHAAARAKLGYKKEAGGWTRDPYRAMAEGVRFPEPEDLQDLLAQGRTPLRDREDVLAFLLDRKAWAAAFRKIDERLGLRNDTPEVTLEFRALPTSGTQPAAGAGSRGVGVIYCDLDKYASLWRIMEDAWAKVRAGARVSIPPADLRSTLPHELAHVFQGRLRGPEWLIEGMASYVQQDSSVLYGLASRLAAARARVPGLDQAPRGPDAYPRGWVFFEYLASKHGREAVHAFVRRSVGEGAALEEAAETATGKPWSALVEEERAWAETWLRKYGYKG